MTDTEIKKDDVETLVLSVEFNAEDTFVNALKKLSETKGYDSDNKYALGPNGDQFINANLVMAALEIVAEHAILAGIDATSTKFKEMMEIRQQQVFDKLGVNQKIIH